LLVRVNARWLQWGQLNLTGGSSYCVAESFISGIHHGCAVFGALASHQLVTHEATPFADADFYRPVKRVAVVTTYLLHLPGCEHVCKGLFNGGWIELKYERYMLCTLRPPDFLQSPEYALANALVQLSLQEPHIGIDVVLCWHGHPSHYPWSTKRNRRRSGESISR
jgi:hypothetical protein